MPNVKVQIIRWVDSWQPGWVECVLEDVARREWRFIEKVPIVTGTRLDAHSSYPQPGEIACQIVGQRYDEQGLMLCMIDTERPDGVAGQDGETKFEVFSNQLTTTPD